MMNKKEPDLFPLLAPSKLMGLFVKGHNLKAHDYIAIEAPIVAFDRLLTLKRLLLALIILREESQATKSFD